MVTFRILFSVAAESSSYTYKPKQNGDGGSRVSAKVIHQPPAARLLPGKYSRPVPSLQGSELSKAVVQALNFRTPGPHLLDVHLMPLMNTSSQITLVILKLVRGDSSQITPSASVLVRQENETHFIDRSVRNRNLAAPGRDSLPDD
ncbi:hypothetical protein FA13DRAFT_1742073 [Coprinellus micaceus]|uniref:Uncharacterized protein n=1 Tax=Coprinellus micaceus TaxID=71717 RepID=A0A4Y7SI35_COPMI|nr:hypothetical protein FA13DRAFT_1742073 [Coprinellus micaceus]